MERPDVPLGVRMADTKRSNGVAVCKDSLTSRGARGAGLQFTGRDSDGWGDDIAGFRRCFPSADGGCRKSLHTARRRSSTRPEVIDSSRMTRLARHVHIAVAREFRFDLLAMARA